MQRPDPQLSKRRTTRVIQPCRGFRRRQNSARITRSLCHLRQKHESRDGQGLLIEQVFQGPHGFLVPAGLLQTRSALQHPSLE
jgi:hypothetical protein